MRLAAFVVYALTASAQSSIDSELARVAKSPYDLAKFIESHENFDLKAAFVSLGLKGEFFPPCESHCHTELVTVIEPFQVILVIHQLQFDVYLRYRKPDGPERPGAWKFAGQFETMQRYYESQHEVKYIGRKPYFLATSQGVSGSDWGSQIEHWFDLALPEFEPVFSHTIEYSYSGFPDRVRYQISGYINVVEMPIEQIQVNYTARFEAHGDLAVIEYNPVYRRRGNRFVFDQQKSKVVEKDLDALLGGTDLMSPTNEEFLHLLIQPLKEVASAKYEGLKEQHDWLVRFLAQCNDTPEKRELQALLKSAR